MKILCLILIVLGAFVNFMGPKVLIKYSKDGQISEGKKIMIKSMGLLLVVISAIIAFTVIK